MRPNMKCVSTYIDYNDYLKLRIQAHKHNCTNSKMIEALIKICIKNITDEEVIGLQKTMPYNKFPLSPNE